ncbi:MAG: 3-hydroxyacyl-ACP dehydratase FabZ [Gammaproteobacteria bacterium]|nr:3-hydroxyacyl-ACP dehydratase FabZ [Gammaproteobacteria bacterium]
MVSLDIQELFKFLPHRYPMLLLDKVLECEPGSHLVALKNVTINEPFFPGHFPQRPVMPAVFIMEAMAQATGILALQTLGQSPGEDWMYYFVGVDKARFRSPVLPGDQLILRVHLIKHSRGIWKVNCKGLVDDKEVAEAELMGALRTGEA